MVHRCPRTLDAPIPLKIGHVQLLVVLCDTSRSHDRMIIISSLNPRSHLETDPRFGIRHVTVLMKVCTVRKVCVLLGCAKNYFDALDFSDGAKNLGRLATGRERARKNNCGKKYFFILEKIDSENFSF